VIIVRVHFLFNLRSIVGEKEVLLKLENGSTIKDLMRLLIRQYGEKLEKSLRIKDGKSDLSITILVNGRNIDFIKGFETPLFNGDVVSIVPPAGGG